MTNRERLIVDDEYLFVRSCFVQAGKMEHEARGTPSAEAWGRELCKWGRAMNAVAYRRNQACRG